MAYVYDNRTGQRLDPNNLPVIQMNGAGPIQGSKVNRGQPSEFQQPQNQPTDQIIHRIDPSAPVTGLTSHSVQTVAVDPFTGQPLTGHAPPSSQLPPAQYGSSSAYAPNPNTVDRTRDPNGNYSAPMTSAEQAITDITVNGGNHRPGSGFIPGGWGSGGLRGGMAWEPATSSGPAPAGDPWANDRMGTQALDGFSATSPGLVTGSPRVAAALASRPSVDTRSPAVAAQMRAALIGDTSTYKQNNTQQAYGLNDKQWAKEIHLLNTDPAHARRFLANHQK